MIRTRGLISFLKRTKERYGNLPVMLFLSYGTVPNNALYTALGKDGSLIVALDYEIGGDTGYKVSDLIHQLEQKAISENLRFGLIHDDWLKGMVIAERVNVEIKHDDDNGSHVLFSELNYDNSR